jgi:hypothetical protein
MKPTLLLAAGLLTAATLALAGWASDEPGSAAATTQNSNDQMVKFAQCMRGEGIDIPDPQGGKLDITVSGGADTKAKFDAALQICQKYMPKEMPGGASDKDRDRALKMVECLRKRGINALDPPPGSAAVQVQGKPGDQAMAEQARQACQKEVGG